MDIQYKSSSFATYSQYIASPIIVAIFIYQLNVYLKTGSGTEAFPLFFLPFFLWASIIVIINVCKLRYIEVREDNILMKSLGEEKILDYKNIEWINQNVFGSNWYIVSIKIRNSETGKSKIIFVLPEQYTSREGWSVINPIHELNFTKFIREQIVKANPSYNITNEPSRWYLAKWMFLTLIPFLIISFIFFT